MDEFFKNLLPLETFENLERKMPVFSRQFGPGTVHRLHGKDMVVIFDHRIERIALEDKDLCLIPIDKKPKPKTKNTAYVDGQKVSMRTMKRAMKEMEDLIGVKLVADALGIKKKKLLEICQQATIKVYDSDSKDPKIERSELQRLNKLKDLI